MWHVRLTLHAVDESAMFDALEALESHSPVGTVDEANREGALALFIDNRETVDGALQEAARLVTAALPGVVVVGCEVQTEARFLAGLEQPVYPPVVGYAEIAELAGLSRQRVRQLASSEGFPAPVIVTAQGPLFPQAAAAQWVARRRPRTGRPKKIAAA